MSAENQGTGEQQLAGPSLNMRKESYEYIHEDGTKEIFEVGKQSKDVYDAFQQLKQQLENGFVEAQLDAAREAYVNRDVPSVEQEDAIRTVMRGVEDNGRGIAGCLISQLIVKIGAPELDVRLHKGSRKSGNFSWRNGFSLRVADEKYVTPVLNDRDLLNGNEQGGSLMTRGLAQNIPFTKAFPKNSLRGPQNEWLDILNAVERGNIDPEDALQVAISELLKMKGSEEKATRKALAACNNTDNLTKSDVVETLQETIQAASDTSELHEAATYAAVKSSESTAPYSVEPLQPHRSADTKSGRKGDIEGRQGDSLSLLLDAKAKDKVTKREKQRVFNQNADYAAFVVLNEAQKPDCDCRTLSLREVADRFVVEPQDWLFQYIQIIGSTDVDHATFRQTSTEHLEALSDSIAKL